MSVKAILQGQNDKTPKLYLNDDSTLIQDKEDVTDKVKEALNAADKDEVLPLSGGTMTGAIQGGDSNGHFYKNGSVSITAHSDTIGLSASTSSHQTFLQIYPTGAQIMTNTPAVSLSMSSTDGVNLRGVKDPTSDKDAANKKYVDTKIAINEIYLPKEPFTPIDAREEIPYSWEVINTIALSGKAEKYFSLGSLKKCTLSSAILGSTEVMMMVIGINQDANGTVTFQAQDCLNNATVFGTSAQWTGSIVRQLCQDFYNACEAKDYIKTVNKGTCASISSSRNGIVTYNDETVWLPSEREMGFDTYSPLSAANSTTFKAECTRGDNSSYGYYSMEERRNRIKTLGANGSATLYWTRSRCYIDSTSLVGISDKGYNGQITTYEGELGFAPAFTIGDSYKEPTTVQNYTITQGSTDVTNKVQQAIRQVNPNLLDNWYFARPVNQRGKTEYSGVSYMIDRWCTWDGKTLTLTDDGIKTAGNLYQYSDPELYKAIYGKYLTISLLFADGTLYTKSFFGNHKEWYTATVNKHGIKSFVLSLDNSDFTDRDKNFFRIDISTLGTLSDAILAAKLELGNTQTLAHKENGEWVLNEIPDYGEQLRRCQRYAVELNPEKQPYAIVGIGVARNTTTVSAFVALPTSIRKLPVLTTAEANWILTSGDEYVNATSISVSNFTSSGVELDITGAKFTSGKAYVVLLANSSTAFLSADL